MICFNELDKEFMSIPDSIKISMVCEFLFKDIFDSFKGFFTPEVMNDKFFLYHFAKGLMPRKFDASDGLDRIIYDEGQEVAEMYFVKQGVMGYGINVAPEKLTKGVFKIARR